MGNKKIDNLFQEQLKNLEVSPNKRVWSNIETQLKKKKRKVFPFWWFTGAVASILVLVLLIYPLSNDENQNFKNTLEEVITTIPEHKPVIKNKIDSLNLELTIKNKVLISKKDTILKIDENKVEFPKPTLEKGIYQAKKSNAILLSYHPVDANFKISHQKTILQILTVKTVKPIEKKLNIADLVKKEESAKMSIPQKNWSIAPSFAILKSNSLSDTSPINAGLTASTSGENSYSYGVQVSYQLNEKWSIQSGIHMQEMSYANNQVAVNRSSQSNPFATKFSNGDTFSFSTNSNNSIADESVQLTSNFILNTTIVNTGNISQNYGYIEIPIEVKYNLSNNTKIDTQIVTGFSTLFLNKNEIILNTQNFSSALEAANLNNINFSGNLGFDFNYHFTQKLAFNLNPMFKVQLNTFSDAANGFAPFNIGLYTGIKYQF